MHRAPLLAVLLAVTPLTAHAQRARSVEVLPEPSQKLEMPKGVTEVEIKTQDKIELRAAYFEPKRSSQLAPGAILVHDSGSTGDSLYALAERMKTSGFAILVLDLRGHGRSASKAIDWRKLDENERRSAWALAVRDLEAASAWLRDRKEVHATNLTVVGNRAGSTLAARYALRDENVRSVVLIEPQAEEFGINLAGDLVELGGLPTYIVSGKETADRTEAMIAEAHKEAGGHPFIELMICSAKKMEEVPQLDRRAITGIAKWTKARAFPQK